MAGKKLTVVLSQAQGKHPVRTRLEEDLAAELLMEPNVNVSLVPNLYDMSADHTGLVFLRSLKGPFVLLGWNYPRALRWVLDRQQVHGHEGLSELIGDDDERDEEVEENISPEAIGALDVPPRNIYCIDMRASTDPAEFVEEVRRIAELESQELVELTLAPPATSNGSQKNNGSEDGNSSGNELAQFILSSGNTGTGQPNLAEFKEQLPPVKRRWYPVIDYSRCTNCMECIDFCLFGVYGVDTLDRILVEEQDNCKKGCPACSRVCPENAIIFPGHKTAAIAGADGEVAGLKIDLSKLFGGGEESAIDLAVKERDAELVADGREAVGATVGLPKRSENKIPAARDDLDDLMDELDDLDF